MSYINQLQTQLMQKPKKISNCLCHSFVNRSNNPLCMTIILRNIPHNAARITSNCLICSLVTLAKIQTFKVIEFSLRN